MATNKYILACLLMILFSVSSSATYISLTSTVDMERLVNSTVAYANITLVNSGDEPAYEVVVEPMPPKDFVAEQISMGNINPNQTSIGTFKLTIPEDAIPGSYSVPILIRYADLNNYPFTFVTHLRFFYQLPLQSNILCVLPTDEIELVGENKATMQLKIQNQDEVEHQVTVKLHTPNQIAVQEKERVITLPASSETKLDFVISPLGALPGGSFFVFATVDYEEDGRHYSVISTPGRITTSKETPWVSMIAPVIAVVVILLVLVLIYMQFRKEKPISPAKPQLKPTVKGNK